MENAASTAVSDIHQRCFTILLMSLDSQYGSICFATFVGCCLLLCPLASKHFVFVRRNIPQWHILLFCPCARPLWCLCQRFVAHRCPIIDPHSWVLFWDRTLIRYSGSLEPVKTSQGKNVANVLMSSVSDNQPLDPDGLVCIEASNFLSGCSSHGWATTADCHKYCIR